MTIPFESYLLEELDFGVTDFDVHVTKEGDGHPSFTIHPHTISNAWGATDIDYIVFKDTLISRQTFIWTGGTV